MGQKVHPTGFRLGINKTWDSKWYAKKNYAKFLHEDLKIRKFVRNRLERAGVSKVEIERASDNLRVNIYSASRSPNCLRVAKKPVRTGKLI